MVHRYMQIHMYIKMKLFSKSKAIINTKKKKSVEEMGSRYFPRHSTHTMSACLTKEWDMALEEGQGGVGL